MVMILNSPSTTPPFQATKPPNAASTTPCGHKNLRSTVGRLHTAAVPMLNTQRMISYFVSMILERGVPETYQ